MIDKKKKLTLILFSGELDKALAAFTLATGAASSGMDVTIFFTFWGLNVIKDRSRKVRAPGIMRKMLNAMNRGGSAHLPLSRFHMAGAGTAMLKSLMKQSRVPSLDEFIVMARALGVRFVVCTTSIELMGLKPEHFRKEVDTFAGVSTYLEDASRGNVNLFI